MGSEYPDLYQVAIQYIFDNGEMIVFSQRKKEGCEIRKQIDYIDAHGNKKGGELFFSIFNEARVCAYVGSLSHEWGYSIYEKCLDFKCIRLNISTLNYMLEATTRLCCYKNKKTREIIYRTPHILDKAEYGSIRAMLREMLEMLNRDDRRAWRMDDFM